MKKLKAGVAGLVKSGTSLLSPSWLPLIERIVFHFSNIFGDRNGYKFRISSPDSLEIRILWGLIEIRKGQIVELRITCTSNAAAVFARSIANQKLRVDLKRFQEAA